MKKENAIIDQTDNQEAAEFENLNARAQENHEHNVAMQDQAARIIREAEEEAEKAFIKEEKAKARRKAYTVKSVVSVAALAVLSGAVCAAGTVGMIHPAIWIPAALVCLCAACVRFGAWFGRAARK